MYFDMALISERPEVYMDSEVIAHSPHHHSMKRIGLYDHPSSFRFETEGVSQCSSYCVMEYCASEEKGMPLYFTYLPNTEI